MKNYFKIILTTLATLLIFSSSSLACIGQPIYRLCNPRTNEHLYTPSINEEATLSMNGWTYEGVGWIGDVGGFGVYRLYNPVTTYHLYTQDENEVAVLQSRGWSVDNNGNHIFVSSGPISIYRLYNPAIQQHLLTTDEVEYNALASQGWNQEGKALEGDAIGNTNPIHINLSTAGGPDISLANKTYQIYVRDAKGYFNILFGEYRTGNSNTLTIPFTGEGEFLIQMKDQYPYYEQTIEITHDDYSTFSPINKDLTLQYFLGD